MTLRLLLPSAVRMATARFITLILTLVSTAIVASQFGAGEARDAWVIASNTSIIVSLLILGPIVEVILPAFIQERETGGDQAAWSTYTVAFLVFGFVAISIGAVILITSHWSFQIIAPGFSQSQVALTANLFSYTLWAQILTQLSYLTTRVLNAFGRFVIPETIMIIQPIAVIGSALLLSSKIGIKSIAIAQAGTATIVAFVLFLTAWHLGYRMQIAAERFCIVVRHLLSQAGWLYGVYSAGQLSSFVSAMLGSLLPTGSLSALNYGQRLFDVPNIALLSVVSIVVFPLVSEQFVRRDRSELSKTVASAIQAVVIIATPLAAFAIALALPLVTFVLQWGNFTKDDARLTSEIFVVYMFGLPFIGIWSLVARTLIAINQTGFLSLVGILVQFFAIFFSILLVGKFGAPGLAAAMVLAHALGITISVSKLTKLLELRIKHWLAPTLAGSLVPAIAASLIARLVHEATTSVPGPQFIITGGSLALSLCVGTAAYLAAAFVLRTPGIRNLLILHSQKSIKITE
jgi:putative peptidoglycan lipid II flippase